MSELYLFSLSASQYLHLFSYRCINIIDNTSSSNYDSQHKTKQKRKRKQNLNLDDQNDTFENNHEYSAVGHLPLNDITNSTSTSRQIKRNR